MKFAAEEFELMGGRIPMPKKQKQDTPYKGKKPRKKDYAEERRAKRGE